MKKYLFILLPLAFIGTVFLILGFYYGYRQLSISRIDSFDECVEWNFPILDSYPQQCMTPDGRSFVDTSTPPVSPELSPVGELQVINPLPYQSIESPLEIFGQAPGTWFWEGSFLVILTDANGEEISSAIVTTADGDEWMTNELVPFEATLQFDDDNLPESGFLVFDKANPSGMPENGKTETIPISFKRNTAKDGCRITGCSSQVCSDEDVITDCTYRESYVCYGNAICEKQPNGVCGWTMTSELQQCLVENRD